MLATSLPFKGTNNNRTVQMTTIPGSLQTFLSNTSMEDDCQELEFSEMEFVPWDNPDTVVSAEVVAMSRRVMAFVRMFIFVIGGPGNVINMAVFYKQGLRDRVNLCLFALAVADELFLLVAVCLHGEQLHRQFITTELYGPMFTFMINNHLSGLTGFMYVSPVLTAIIACERCYCVLRPLKYPALMRTRTMAVIIIVVNVTVVGLYFIVGFRFYIGCVKDPVSGVAVKTPIMGEIYKANKELIDSLDSFVFGAGLPSIVMAVVTIATVITIVTLRQVVTWRAGTSSMISQSEVALTKMLVGMSILFIVCIFPLAVTRFSWLFLPEVNTGRRKHNLFLTSLLIGHAFTYINSSLNIVVYYIMGSRYRQTLWKLFSSKVKSETPCQKQ